jgi:hypothetical protein
MSGEIERQQPDDRVKRILANPEQYFKEAKRLAREEIQAELKQQRTVGRSRAFATGRAEGRQAAT